MLQEQTGSSPHQLCDPDQSLKFPVPQFSVQQNGLKVVPTHKFAVNIK